MYDDDDQAELAERRAKQGAARGRHEGNLAAVAALLVLEVEASATPWRAQRVPTHHGAGSDVAQLHQVSDMTDRGFYMLAQGELWGPDAALVAALRNAATRRLAAQLRALERHRPNLDHLSSTIDCSHCIDAQENSEPFPCADYLDAEDGLVMPHRCTVALDPDAQQPVDPRADRVAFVACICSWSRTLPYTVPAATQLGEVWARRHLEGDPRATGDTDSPIAVAWRERVAATRAAVVAARRQPDGVPSLGAFRPLVAELPNRRVAPGPAYCEGGVCGRTPEGPHPTHPIVPLADENHWDVECEARPHCQVAAHHSIDG